MVLSLTVLLFANSILCGASSWLAKTKFINISDTEASHTRGRRYSNVSKGRAHVLSQRSFLGRKTPSFIQNRMLVASENPQQTMHQCASEVSTPTRDCPDCNMSPSCACDGYVKFGHGSAWSGWVSVSGGITCDSQAFKDPLPGRDKICMCIPRIYTCATESSQPMANCSECTKQDRCTCYGQARYGHGNTWSQWKHLSGTSPCHASQFGASSSGQGNTCQCQFDISKLDKYHPGPTGMSTLLISSSTVYVTYLALSAGLGLISGLDPDGVASRTLLVVQDTLQLAPILCNIILVLSSYLADRYAMATEVSWYLQILVVVMAAASGTSFCVQAVSHTVLEWVTQVEAGRSLMPTSYPMRVFRSIYQSASVLVYETIGCAIAGLFFMKFTGGASPASAEPLFVQGTSCTIVLSVTYLAFRFTVQVSTLNASYSGYSPRQRSPTRVEDIARRGLETLSSVPLLTLTFTTVQTVSSWSDVSVPGLMRKLMLICTLLTLFQTLMATVLAMMPHAKASTLAQNNAVIVSDFLRAASVVTLYLSLSGLGLRMWMSLGLPQLTRPIVLLVTYFFLVEAFYFVTILMETLLERKFSRTLDGISLARRQSMHSHILAALFLTSWLKARTLLNSSGHLGSPPGFVQDYMLVATASFAAMLLANFARGLFTGPSSFTDFPAGSMRAKNKALAMLVSFVPGVVMYTSCAVIILGMLKITPASAAQAGHHVM